MKKVYLVLIVPILLGIYACQERKESSEKTKDVVLKDYGAKPLVLNIDEYTHQNENFRTTIWTGDHLQVTLMTIPVDGEVGLEIHHDIEQFLRIEEGSAEVLMGDKEDELTFVQQAREDDAIFVPTGKWHNIINKGKKPLRLYSIYAKPEHKHGTIHKDKAASDADEHHH